MKSDVSGSIYGLSADVRGNDEVVALEQRACECIITCQTAASQLVLHNVCCVAADLARFQSLVQVLLVYETTTAHVQNNCIILHLSDGLSVEQILCLWCQRYVDRYEISYL